MRIVFMGTPDFAVPSLDILARNGYTLPAVITAPDKPGGRMGVQVSAVKRYALDHGIPVLQPIKLREPEFLDSLRALRADLQVTVAFRMLPEAVWSMPPLGTLNLHASLLPRYRGAAPIHWAIIRGEQETGLSTFLLRHAIDTGDILLQERLTIGPDETAGELHDRMMHAGADLLLRTVRGLASGAIRPQPQREEEASHAPKIFTETCALDFRHTAAELHNFIRGLSPSPGAWMRWKDKTLKVYRSRLAADCPQDLAPGELRAVGGDTLLLGAASGCVVVEELQLEGKKRMRATDFVRGMR